MNLHIIKYFDTLYNIFTGILDLHVHIFAMHCLHGVYLSAIYAWIYDTALDFVGFVFPQKRGEATLRCTKSRRHATGVACRLRLSKKGLQSAARTSCPL